MLCYIKKIIKYSYRRLWWVVNHWRFKYMGFNSFIDRPIRIDGRNNIWIGNSVNIGYKTWLASNGITITINPILKIGDGTYIGHFNHIYATKQIVIGSNVLIADRVYISDNLHGYENINIPIMNQPVKQVNEVSIGDGSWIGENVSIIGVTIGKNCVIGANSVVTKNIPDYCVAVGVPAKIIKKYNRNTKRWDKYD